MTIYLAGSSAEPARIESIAIELAGYGLNILHPWTKWTPESHSNEQANWNSCCAAIMQAVAMVGIAPVLPNQTKGLLFEAGFARGVHRPVYLIGSEEELAALGHWRFASGVYQYTSVSEAMPHLLWARSH